MKALNALKIVVVLGMLVGLTACPKGGVSDPGGGFPPREGASLGDRYKIGSSTAYALAETFTAVSQSASPAKLLELGFSASDLNQMLETGTINPNAMDVFSALGFQPASAQLLVEDVRAGLAKE